MLVSIGGYYICVNIGFVCYFDICSSFFHFNLLFAEGALRRSFCFYSDFCQSKMKNLFILCIY